MEETKLLKGSPARKSFTTATHSANISLLPDPSMDLHCSTSSSFTMSAASWDEPRRKRSHTSFATSTRLSSGSTSYFSLREKLIPHKRVCLLPGIVHSISHCTFIIFFNYLLGDRQSSQRLLNFL